MKGDSGSPGKGGRRRPQHHEEEPFIDEVVTQGVVAGAEEFGVVRRNRFLGGANLTDPLQPGRLEHPEEHVATEHEKDDLPHHVVEHGRCPAHTERHRRTEDAEGHPTPDVSASHRSAALSPGPASVPVP